MLAVIGGIFSPEFPVLESTMGEVIQFILKRDLERARLIQEARAIYEGIFPTEKGPAIEQCQNSVLDAMKFN
jgi:hypothetical protein